MFLKKLIFYLNLYIIYRLNHVLCFLCKDLYQVRSFRYKLVDVSNIKVHLENKNPLCFCVILYVLFYLEKAEGWNIAFLWDFISLFILWDLLFGYLSDFLLDFLFWLDIRHFVWSFWLVIRLFCEVFIVVSFMTFCENLFS